MRTIPRSVSSKGQHLSRCDYCGSMWLRSALRRKRNGLLACPQDWAGRDELELAELTAKRAAALAAVTARGLPADGAFPDTDSDGNPNSQSSYTHSARRTTAADVYADGVPTYDAPGTLVNKPGF